MKAYRKVLRFWIAIASVFSFLVGWAILAHSPKPVQAAASQSQSVNLPPIQAYNGGSVTNGQGFFSPNTQSAPQQSVGVPLLRTRGS